MVKKRSIAFVLSDYVSAPYEDALRVSAKRHDIIGVKVFDDLEEKLPKVGLVKVRDAESGATQLVDTSSKAVRTAYNDHFNQHKEYYTTAFRKAGASTIDINTREDYVKHLLRFFKSRHR